MSVLTSSLFAAATTYPSESAATSDFLWSYLLVKGKIDICVGVITLETTGHELLNAVIGLRSRTVKSQIHSSEQK